MVTKKGNVTAGVYIELPENIQTLQYRKFFRIAQAVDKAIANRL